MAPGSNDNLRLEIGHVLFIDLVGYSKLLIEEQKNRLRQLTEIEGIVRGRSVILAVAQSPKPQRKSQTDCVFPLDIGLELADRGTCAQCDRLVIRSTSHSTGAAITV
jgi:hypothetical protein